MLNHTKACLDSPFCTTSSPACSTIVFHPKGNRIPQVLKNSFMYLAKPARFLGFSGKATLQHCYFKKVT